MIRFPLSLLLPLAGIAAAWAEAEPEILFLHSERTPVHNDPIEKAPLLQRELVRQAVLLAAREELGMPTRDATLRETVPPDSKTVEFFAGIVAASGRDAGGDLGYFLRAGKPGESASRMLAEDRLPMLYEYEAFTAVMEELSRTAFPKLLRAAGAPDGGSGPSERNAPAVEKFEDDLGRLNEISQFQALRRIHQGLLQSPDSPDYLGAAVRAYANLGQLSRQQWSPGHKAFQARALLYAERLVVREDSSPWSLAHRAYARALAGRHHTARVDLENAGDLDGNLPWLPLISRFLEFDTEGLVDSIPGETGGNQLAALLAILSVEFSGSQSETFAAGNPALERSPHTFRIHSILYRNGGLSTRRRLGVESRMRFLELLAERVPRIDGLPDRTATLVDSIPSPIPEGVLRERVTTRESHSSASMWEQFFGRSGSDEGIEWWTISELVESLRGDGVDAADPSWSLLATQIEEINFILVKKHLYTLARSLGLTVDDSLKERVRAETAGHPLAAIVPTFWIGARRGTDGDRSRLTEMEIEEVPLVSLPLIGDHSRSVPHFGNMTRREAQILGVHHGDRVYDDLLLAADYYITRTRERMLRRLTEISPRCPHVRTRIIRHEPQLAQDLLGKDSDDLAGNPEAALALARHYHQQDELGKAAELLRDLIPQMPDQEPYFLLADIYMELGDEDQWLETLEAFTDNGYDLGLGKTRARERIARHFLETGKFERALPYAEAAGRSWAGSALTLAANVNFAVGNMERSLEWFEARHQRYPRPFSTIAVHNWRLKADVPIDSEARRELDEFLDSLDPENASRKLFLSFEHYRNNDPDNAIKFVKAIFKGNHHTPRFGLLAAMFADHFDLDVERDRFLRMVADADRDDYSNQESLRASSALAETFIAALAGENERLLDRRFIEETLDASDGDEKLDLAIVVGHFLEQRELPNEALHYYRRALLPHQSNRWLEPLLYDRLRELDADPRAMLREKLRGS